MIRNFEILLVLLALMARSSISAGQSIPFVNIDTDPKTVSLGFIDIVSDNVESSVFANPALMSFNEIKTALSCNYGYWQPKTFKEHRFVISGSHRINDKWSIAAGIANGVGQYYEAYDKNSNYTGNYRPLNINAKGGVSYKFAQYLSMGMNIGFVYNTLSSQYANMAMIADIFITSSLSDFKIAAGAKSLGLVWDSYGNPLKDMPICLSGGVSYKKLLCERHDLGLFTQYDFYSVDMMSASIGASYTYKELVSVRAGGRMGFGKVQSSVSAGCGLSFKHFEINVAYVLPINDINIANTTSLSLVYLIR